MKIVSQDEPEAKQLIAMFTSITNFEVILSFDGFYQLKLTKSGSSGSPVRKWRLVCAMNANPLWRRRTDSRESAKRVMT
jgi:hypothetical protein